MEGITILNTTVMHENSIGGIVCTLLMGVILTGFCTLSIVDGIKQKEVGETIFGIAFVVLGMISIAVGIYEAIKYNTPEKTFNRYEVLISDDVNLKEFNQKYEIIKVRGEIYTIEEIEVEDNGS